MSTRSLFILPTLFLLLSGHLSLNAGGIKSGPWICDAGEHSVTILWTTEVPGMAFVELEDGTVKYETYAGRRIFQRLHKVTIRGLEKGSVVRYRVGGHDLKDDTNPRYPKFEEPFTGKWHSVRTLDKDAQSCRFSVFNDIHMRADDYTALASGVDSANTDFLFLNGDIVSAGNYTLDTFVQYAIDPLKSLPNGLPIFFARGNHEGRGNNLPLVADVFPNSGPAEFYYTFRQGPVAAIVLDAGETGKKRSELYCGNAVYEEYLKEQMEWAEEAMKEPGFKDAPVRICILHVPMTDHKDKNDYLLQRWLNHHFLPLLNQAGVHFMIGADLHEFLLCEPGEMGNDFPILVNDEIRRLDFSYTVGGEINIKTWNSSGRLEFEWDFPVR